MAGRPSIAQIEALVEFLEQNPGIAKGQLRTTQAKQETKRKWASLAITLNALGGANKDGAGWAKYWAEKKCGLKRQCSEHAASMRRTGGGVDNLPVMSPLDLRLVEVMGGSSFAIRDSRLAVEPFPQSISQTSTPAPAHEERQEVSHVIEIHPELEPHTITETTIAATAPPPASSQSIPAESPSQPVQSPRRSLLRSPRRPRRRHRPSSVSDDFDRMARMEERRLAAETVTARAIADATVKLDRCAAALEQMSDAIREGAATIANALLEIARTRSRTPII